MNATVDGREAEEYAKGYGEGLVWARDYATADQLRTFVDTANGPSEDANPHWWRGFVDGASEVLEEGAVAPLLNG